MRRLVQRSERPTAILFNGNINYDKLLRVWHIESSAIVSGFIFPTALSHVRVASAFQCKNTAGNYRSVSALLQQDQRIKRSLQNVGKHNVCMCSCEFYLHPCKPLVSCKRQGRSHRGGHGGQVPRAPYHVPVHQNDNRQFIFGTDFWRVTWRYITAYN